MNKNIDIKITDDCTIYVCRPNTDGEEVVKAIIDEYHKHDIDLVDLIDFIEIQGLSIADVVKIYAKLFNVINGDKVVRIISDEENREVVDLEK